ncbi:MAG: hypothetical protein EBV59_11735 [Synechococcaceae bacterium WB7_1C_051]|nr:hypothetical protein [Synechococcaceae bacterium WB7_1C_051]
MEAMGHKDLLEAVMETTHAVLVQNRLLAVMAVKEDRAVRGFPEEHPIIVPPIITQEQQEPEEMAAAVEQAEKEEGLIVEDVLPP